MLNSVVILGKSCRYVKEANMEGKLFERPTAQTSKQSPKKATPAKSPPPSGNTSFDYSVVQLFCFSCDSYFCAEGIVKESCCSFALFLFS